MDIRANPISIPTGSALPVDIFAPPGTVMTDDNSVLNFKPASPTVETVAPQTAPPVKKANDKNKKVKNSDDGDSKGEQQDHSDN